MTKDVERKLWPGDKGKFDFVTNACDIRRKTDLHKHDQDIISIWTEFHMISIIHYYSIIQIYEFCKSSNVRLLFVVGVS